VGKNGEGSEADKTYEIVLEGKGCQSDGEGDARTQGFEYDENLVQRGKRVKGEGYQTGTAAKGN